MSSGTAKRSVDKHRALPAGLLGASGGIRGDSGAMIKPLLGHLIKCTFQGPWYPRGAVLSGAVLVVVLLVKVTVTGVLPPSPSSSSVARQPHPNPTRLFG